MKIDSATLRWGSSEERAAAVEECIRVFLSESRYCLQPGCIKYPILRDNLLHAIEGQMPVVSGLIAGMISFEITCNGAYASSGALINYVVSRFKASGRSTADCILVNIKTPAGDLLVFSGDLLNAGDLEIDELLYDLGDPVFGF